MKLPNLTFLLDPISAEKYLSAYYEQEHLIIRNRSANYYDHILSPKDIDEFFELDRIWPESVMITHDHDYNIGESTNFIPKNELTFNKEGVYKALYQGKSLVLNRLQEYIPKLRRFCIGLSDELQAGINGNIYITPPSGHAFNPHIDYHDVFILQIHGSKEWRFYDQPERLPDSSFYINKKNAGQESPTKTFSLNEGDLLYMPRGIRHDAITTNSSFSIHATIGIHPVKWGELVKRAINAQRKYPMFRETYPVNNAGEEGRSG